MQRAAIRLLADHFAAAEPVVTINSSRGVSERPAAGLVRRSEANLVMVCLVAERTGHAAAPRVGHVAVNPALFSRSTSDSKCKLDL